MTRDELTEAKVEARAVHALACELSADAERSIARRDHAVDYDARDAIVGIAAGLEKLANIVVRLLGEKP